jgi:hypothetical protein
MKYHPRRHPVRRTKDLIVRARERVAVQVNQALVMTYWQIGWLARHDAQPDEKPPIAIILCTNRDAEIVELLDLEKDHIHIAEYWLQLPPREVLQARLHEAMVAARARLERT